jgi:hypothetical protein
MSEALQTWVDKGSLHHLRGTTEVHGVQVLVVRLPGATVVVFRDPCPNQGYLLVDSAIDLQTRILTCGGAHQPFSLNRRTGSQLEQRRRVPLRCPAARGSHAS